MNVLKSFRYILILSIILILSAAPSFSAQKKPRTSYDIIIAGGGTGGISAAIQAARMGASVLVVEPSSWIGGQATAAGVSTMDDMSRQKSGLYLDFISRIKHYYDTRGKSMGTCYWDSRSTAFEPHIGQEAFVGLINEARRKGTLEFLMLSEIVSVQKNKNSITGVTVRTNEKSRQNYSCKILIDATEYGDVLPLAKTQYRIGNTLSRFTNPDAMIQDITWAAVLHKYTSGVPSYLKPNTPLPGYDLAKRNYESYVTADGYNFKNTYPVPMPVNFMTHNAYRGLPDSSNPYSYDADKENRIYITKTSVNWGNDYPGTYGWTNGRRGLPVSYLEDKNSRLQIEREALIKTLHFIYYIQNELGEEWSVADDEYKNRILPEAARGLPREWQEIVRRMPPIPYVRESRRIIGSRTLTSHELLQNSLSYRDGQTSREFSNAIAIGGYILDLHGANTDSDMEWEFEERASTTITNRPRGPFQVPMDILIPADTDGLIAAEKNLSMSRLAAGALRLQPITMMTGQAAGALAAVCVRQGKHPREIHPLLVQWELLNYGVDLSLCHYTDVTKESPVYKTVQLSNLYGLADAEEYPHAPSYKIDDLDDPVLAMAIIRGQDKGRFGGDKVITRGEANTILKRAQKALNLPEKDYLADKAHNFVSRGDLAKAVCDAFPALSGATPPKNSRIPFGLGKHRNSLYAQTLGRLGILNIYSSDSEFMYGRPVTKAEAADIIVRAAVYAAGL
ncbi:MAG: FAD-dependent oxidoreductase [Synergistaceae bacterium]|nr:FAD-dependent oxidoreductase [Synergistaceae bacterium]